MRDTNVIGGRLCVRNGGDNLFNLNAGFNHIPESAHKFLIVRIPLINS